MFGSVTRKHIKRWSVARKSRSLWITKLEMSAQNVPFFLLGRLDQGLLPQREDKMRGIVPAFSILKRYLPVKEEAVFGEPGEPGATEHA